MTASEIISDHTFKIEYLQAIPTMKLLVFLFQELDLIQALSSLFLAISYNWNKNHGKYPLAYRKINL